MKVLKLSSSILFFLLIAVLTVSFRRGNTLQSSTKKQVIDSIITNYTIGEDQSTETSVRLKHINYSYQLAKRNHIDSLALKSLAIKTSIFWQIKALDSAIFYSKKLRDHAVKVKDTTYIAKSYNKLGLYYQKSNQPIKSFRSFNESRGYYITLKDSSHVGRMALNQASIQKNLSDYLGSEETTIIALDYLKPATDKKFIASAYNLLAINSKYQNNYTEAVYWYEKAIAETENPSDVIIYKSNLALAYLSLKEYKKGIALLHKLAKDYQKKNKKEDPHINDYLIYAMWLENNEYNPTNGLIKNLNIYLNENDMYSSIDSYMLLAKYNLGKNKPKAITHAIDALNTSKKIKNIEGELESLRFLIDIEPNNGYQDYVASYLKINDSINDANLKVKNQFAKIIYDTEKTKEEVLILNAQVAADALKIAKETYRRNIGVLTSSLLIVSVIFIVFTWRQKIKIASFNATTKTENRISKKVHDEMANDISNIKTIVKNHIPTNIPVKKQLLNLLDHSYLIARDIASETGDVIFSESFSDDLKSLLMQHNNENIKIITNLSALNSLKIDKHKKVAVYRILQELMVNMNKHSAATRVIIAHRKEGKLNEIRYSDNGVGTDNLKNNNGLNNATSRMDDINGSFSFETAKDKGFKALLKFNA